MGITQHCPDTPGPLALYLPWYTTPLPTPGSLPITAHPATLPRPCPCPYLASSTPYLSMSMPRPHPVHTHILPMPRPHPAYSHPHPPCPCPGHTLLVHTPVLPMPRPHPACPHSHTAHAQATPCPHPHPAHAQATPCVPMPVSCPTIQVEAPPGAISRGQVALREAHLLGPCHVPGL